jgi:O-antigen/teichoic acid export membrane protein
VSRRAILVDCAAAVALAAAALALTSLGIIALIAGTVVLLCLLSFAVQRLARRRRRPRVRGRQ